MKLTATTTARSPDPGGAAAGPALSCRHVTRRYGDLVAVDDLSFTIAPGETYGLLGPNGAGKTTAISMVAGILAADTGEIRLAGRRMTPHAVAVKAEIGYVPQELALYPDLSARENLRFFAGLYGISGRAARTRIAEVLDAVGLAERAGDTVSEFSGGMQRRLNIAAGLLHRPRLLILDEPTVGVDPQSRNSILAGVEALAAQGMSVLYTTHYMEEAQRLCRLVGILDEGRMIAEGTPRELTRLVGEHDRIRLAAAGEVTRAAADLAAMAAVVQVAATADGLDLSVEDARITLPDVLAVVGRAGAVVRAVTVHEPDLEAVFLHLTGKTLRD
ncbi:ABC transporter ATP-binding protein [Nocardia sp. NPDC127526]|uniref:ABC transporter ATP-binding protein n=1 Tax=Nocardia sp. NPDC127526 TaxID=3345393 RepID=UPI00362C60E5